MLREWANDSLPSEPYFFASFGTEGGLHHRRLKAEFWIGSKGTCDRGDRQDPALIILIKAKRSCVRILPPTETNELGIIGGTFALTDVGRLCKKAMDGGGEHAVAFVVIKDI
jgi:hypothetical protein